MAQCLCSELPDLADIGMGQHEKVFSTFQTEIRHGDPFWWLSAIQCRACHQWWLVAADERINDVFILRRLASSELASIVDQASWPNDFMSFAQVLRLGRERGHNWSFDDPESPSLIWTVIDLAREAPGINLSQIARLLNVDPDQASRLVDLAEREEPITVTRP